MTQASSLHAFLSVLAEHALLGRLFFASVEMAVLAGIVWLIIRIRRRASPRLCSILWLLVMAKALVALAIGAPLAIIRIHPPEPAPLPVTYEPRFDYEDTVPSFEPEAALPLATVEPGPMEAARPARWSFSWKWSAAETVSGAWIIGAILVGLYSVLNRVRLHRLVSRAMPPPARIIERYTVAVKHLRVKRPPRLLVTRDLESPALVGTLTPAILLPGWMSEKPNDAQLDWSLRHELTHWKLGDPLADLVRQIARILFFFHPVTWWASKKWEESAELACDRVLVRTESEAENYAGELYQILAQIHGRRMRPAMGGLFATRTQIGRRIAALLSNPLKWPARLSVVAVLCVLALATLSLAVGGAFAKRADVGEVSAEEETERDSAQAAASGSAVAGHPDLNLILEGMRRADLLLSEHDARFSYEVETIQYPEGTALAVSYIRGEDNGSGERKLERDVVKYADAAFRGDKIRFDEERQSFEGDSDKPVSRRHLVWAYDGQINRALRFPSSEKEELKATQTRRGPQRPQELPPHQRVNQFIGRNSVSISDNLENRYTNMNLRERKEKAGGYECYVLRAEQRDGDGVLTMWLAPEIDFRPVRLESRTSRFHYILDASYEKVGDIWSPFGATTRTWFVKSGGDEEPVRTQTMTVKSASYSRMELADSLFILDYPEETMTIWDADQGRYVQWPILVGKEAPELGASAWVSGEPTDLESQRGKTVVLAFWDSRDEACAELVSVLNGLLADYSEKGLEILSVHTADADTDALKQFISDKSIKFRLAVDKPAKLHKGATFEKYNVWKVPSVFIIDAQGKVRYQDIPLAAVEQAVKALLDERPSAASRRPTSEPADAHELLEHLLVQNEAARDRFKTVAYTVQYGNEYDRGRGKKHLDMTAELKFDGRLRWERTEFVRRDVTSGDVEFDDKMSVVVNEEYVGLKLYGRTPVYVFMHERIEEPNPAGTKWPETQNQNDIIPFLFGAGTQTVRQYLEPEYRRTEVEEESGANGGTLYRITSHNPAYSDHPDTVFIVDSQKDFLITRSCYFNKGGGLWLERDFELRQIQDATGQMVWFPTSFEEKRYGSPRAVEKNPGVTEVRRAVVSVPVINAEIPATQFVLGALDADFDQQIGVWDVDGNATRAGYIDGLILPVEDFHKRRAARKRDGSLEGDEAERGDKGARSPDVSSEQPQSESQQLKATIKEVYRKKYEHLQSYALHYSEESVLLHEETGAVIPRMTEDVEVLTRGDDKAVRESRLVPSTGRRAEVVRVATGGVYRSLMVYPDTGPWRGHTWKVSSARKCDTLGVTPLAYSMLDSMRWPKDQVLHPNGANNDMTVLMNVPESRVLPEAVHVDGRECYVVERGPQGSPWTKWYLAKDLGFAVCRLEAYHRESSSRFLGFSITFSDFAEVAPGLYMPREGELIGYKVDGSVDNRRRWHNMSLDLAPDIADDAFVLEFPDGTEVMDEETRETHISYQGQLVSREEFFASRPMVGKEAPELDVAEWVTGEPTDAEPPLIFKGKVVGPEGKGVTGATVRRLPAGEIEQVKTNADGSFELPLGDERPGTYNRLVIEAYHPDMPSHRGVLDQWFQSADDAQGVVEMKRTGIIKGRVVDSEGMPLQSADVIAWIRSPRGGNVVLIPDEQAVSDDAGSYEIQGIASGVSYTVEARSDGYGEGRVEDFSVAEGEVYDVPDLVLREANMYIEGVVKDQFGEPVADAPVWVFGQATSTTRWTRTDEKGYYRLENIVNEKVLIQFKGPTDEYKVQNLETVLSEPHVYDVRLVREISPEEREATRLAGKDAPELRVAEWARGEPTSLASLRGKAAVLAFWDSRNEACAPLVPLLNALLSKYPDKDMEIISIHSADADTDALEQFISDRSIKFRVAVDKPAENYKGATFQKYRVRKVPAFFIIDSQGKVRYQDIPLAAVEEAVEQLLDEQ